MPGPFFRQRRKRAAWCLNSGLVRPSIGQALADDASGQIFGAHGVVNAKQSVVMAEIKLRQITVQMLFGAVLVGAAHPALEDREIAFDRVGGHVAANVFVGGVFHGLVARTPIRSLYKLLSSVWTWLSLRHVLADDFVDRRLIGHCHVE